MSELQSTSESPSVMDIERRARIGSRVIVQMLFSRTTLNWEWLEEATKIQKLKHTLVRQKKSFNKIRGVCCCEPHVCLKAYKRFRATLEMYLYCMLMPGAMYDVPPPSLEIGVSNRDLPANLVYRVLKDMNYSKWYIETLLYSVEFILDLKPDGKIVQMLPYYCQLDEQVRFICMSTVEGNSFSEDTSCSDDEQSYLTENQVLKNITGSSESSSNSSSSINGLTILLCCVCSKCL